MCLVSSSSDAFFGLTELPAATEGGVVERRFPARTQGRTVGRTLAGGADHSLTSVQVSFKDKPTGFTAFALVGDVVSKHVSWLLSRA